jgi:type II secretory pathway pseudopilin PulG
MARKHKYFGFSLTEVLLAVGTLSIGMIFVAGVFPVAIYFSTEASEQTIAAVVVDEAFAKIRLYGGGAGSILLSQLPANGSHAFGDVMATVDPVDPDEFAYPSDPCNNILRTRYCWSALCRRLGATRLVQVTVFVSRRTGSGMRYRAPVEPIDGRVPYPMPVEVGVSDSAGSNVLTIETDRETFINDNYTIVENETGRLYRVLERRRQLDENTIVLDRPWQGGTSVWVIPPPAGGGRYPCIAVYQKVIRF